jgi:hypothetical protein
MRIESDQQTDGADCFAVESRLRARLKRRSVVDALQTAGLGQGALGPAINADYVDAGRQKSVCIVELPLWAAEFDLDTTTGAADWIDSARTTGTISEDQPEEKNVDTEKVASDGTITPVP